MSERQRAKSQTSANFDRRCVNLWIGDWEWLQTYHQKGAGVFIRDLVREHRIKVETAMNKKAPVESLQINFEDAL